MEWIEDHQIMVGLWAEAFFDWLTTNGYWFFRWLSTALSTLIDALLWVLETPHPLIVMAAFAGISFGLRRSLSLAAFTFIGFLFIFNQGYWKETIQTLALVSTATVVCMAIGVPLGIATARREWLYNTMRPVLDLMQTLPGFVYLIPALTLFGLGMVPGLIATVIFAIPASIRLTRLGIISTPEALTEAAIAFGATRSQVLRKVELPYATPQIMAGLTQTIMLSLSMVVIAALVGASGLGVPVVRALNRVDIAGGVDSGLCIVILAIILDRMFRTSGGSTS